MERQRVPRSLHTVSGLLSVCCHSRVTIALRLYDERRIRGTQMDILLRKGHDNTLLAERLLDLEQQIMSCGGAVLRPGDETRDFPLQGMLTKGEQEHSRWRCREHTWMAAYRLSEQAFDQVHVAAIGDPYWQNEADVCIPQGPIRHSVGNKFFIGNEHRLIIGILDGRRPDGNALDHASLVAYRHDVIHTNGALEEQDETAHKIADNLLQTRSEERRVGKECRL